MKKLFWVLIVIGGVNWGLIGIGYLFGGGNWNIVNLLLGQWPVVEALVYVLVGISAIMAATGFCGCKKCSQ